MVQMNDTSGYTTVARTVIAVIISVLLPSILGAEPALNDRVARVRTAIDSVRFVAYTPTGLSIVDGQVHPETISERSAVLRAPLRLRPSVD